MFVTYRGYRIERFGSHRVDVRDRRTNALLKMAKTWTEAIEWIDGKADQKGKNRADQEATATLHQ